MLIAAANGYQSKAGEQVSESVKLRIYG